MRSIDIHAHISPESCFDAMRNGKEWYGVSPDEIYGAHKYNPRTMWTPEQRISDMNSLGVDVHVLSTGAFFYFYERDAKQVTAMNVECNDYVSQLTKEHPDRFAGLANLPMQDIKASVKELERSVTQLGLKGAMIGDHVNGKTCY